MQLLPSGCGAAQIHLEAAQALVEEEAPHGDEAGQPQRRGKAQPSCPDNCRSPTAAICIPSLIVSTASSDLFAGVYDLHRGLGIIIHNGAAFKPNLHGLKREYPLVTDTDAQLYQTSTLLYL